jgi:hypothetical protein
MVWIMDNGRTGRTSQHIVFLWGFLREKVFQRRPENVAQLGAHKRSCAARFLKTCVGKVVTDARVRLREVVRQNGGHTEHVLH